MNVDEFVVQLGLDPSSINEQQRNVLRAIAQLKSDAAKDVKKVEDHFAKAGEAVESGARRMVNILGLIIGTTSAVDFAKKTVEDVRQLGIMADMIQVNIRELSAFGNTFERLGGSAEGVFATLSGIDREIKNLEANVTAPGDSSLLNVLRQLNSLGANIQAHTSDGRWKKPTEILLEIAEAKPKLKATEDRIKGILRQLPGMTDETLAVMLRSTDALREQIKKQQEILAVSDEDRVALDALRTEWTKLQQTSLQLGINIMRDVAGPLKAVLELSTSFMKSVTENHKFMSLSWVERDRLQRQRLGLPNYTDQYPELAPGTRGGSNKAPPGGWGGRGSGEPHDQPPTHPTDKNAVPSDILSKAQDVALRGGPEAVDAFMRQQGYPKSGAWCGQFAASVVKASGGTPPKNPAIASNWRNFGYPVKDPQPGDIAVRRGAPTGSTGSHVTIVERYDPSSGRFIGLGGNQGRFQSRFDADRYEFRRSMDPWKNGVKPMLMPGMVTGGRANVIQNNVGSTKVEIGELTVNSRSDNPAGIAGDIVGQMKAQQKAAP